MPDLEIRVEPRTVLGKKVKTLRRNGITPANVYGHRVESQAVQVETPAVVQLLRSGARNVIINLHLQGERKPRPVMVRGVQRDPPTGRLLHVDFYQVSLEEKMRAEVPLVLVGEAPAVSTQGGILLHSMDSVTVEALPADIPPHIEVDVSGLAEIDAGLFVRDLPVGASVQVLSDPDLVVAKIAAPRLAAEVEELPEEEEEVAAEEAAEAEEEREAPPEEETEAEPEAEQ
jgi:large subunit ribosomal protein L25